MSDKIRLWPHRSAVLEGQGRLLNKFNGAAPAGVYSDVMSWDGFRHELRIFRPELPHGEFSEVFHGLDDESDEWVSNAGSLRFDFGNLQKNKNSFKARILKSDKASVSLLTGSTSTPLFKDTSSHRLYYVLNECVTFMTSLGEITVCGNSYVFIPKGVVYQINFLSAKDSCALLLIESKDTLFSPFFESCGMFFPFDFASLMLPEPKVYPGVNGHYSILEKDGNALRLKMVKNHPLGCLGWSGFLYPFGLSVSDIKTISSHNFHLSPDALTTFMTEDCFLKIATFLPRMLHSLPFPHQNFDYDEFLFYLSSYSARKVKKGMATLHPAGFHHGPEKKVYLERPDLKTGYVPNIKKRWTEETALMIESKDRFLVNQKIQKFFI